MIEIKCTEEEKEKIINAIAVSQYCLCDDCPKNTLCRDCVGANIEWTIRENEDAE